MTAAVRPQGPPHPTPGSVARVGVAGEGFLERKSPWCLRGRQDLKRRRGRCKVGKQQVSEAHPKGVFPELSDMGK